VSEVNLELGENRQSLQHVLLQFRRAAIVTNVMLVYACHARAVELRNYSGRQFVRKFCTVHRHGMDTVRLQATRD